MRKYIIVALLLVVAGVGVSFFLIPSNNDTEHAQARDQQTIDVGNVDVEVEYNQGRRSFAIVSALADKRIAEGNRPAAIGFLEEYVKNNASDPQGHKKLAEQYILAGRQEEYNAQIKLLSSLDPTEENLKILSYIYHADKNFPKQAEVLQKIIDVTKGEHPQSYVDLANIQLAIGDKDAALKTLGDLKSRHPDYTDYGVARIRVSILIEKGDIDGAFNEARQWVERPRTAPLNPPAEAVPSSAPPKAQVSATPNPASRDAQELADFCNILHYSGHADKALALVAPHLDMVEDSSQLAVAYINASITAGHSDDAYALLTKLEAAGKLSPEMAVPYLQLAALRQDAAAGKRIVSGVDLTKFDEEQTLNLVETARGSNLPDVLPTLLARLNTPDSLKGKPVLSAVIGIFTNATDQDQRIHTALSLSLTSVQRLRLAESCARAQKTACFDAILAQYPKLEQMSPLQVSEYAQLYIIANRAPEVVKPVSALAAKPGAHPEVVAASVRLAAAAGDENILKPWLMANAATVPTAKLQELFFLANDRHHGVVAADVAERLYARDPSPMNRDILVAAYMTNNQPAKALPLLREQVKVAGADDSYYLGALTKLSRTDDTARKELVAYAQAALQTGKGDDRTQLNYAYILINNGRRDVALPLVKANAQSKGGEWAKLYAQLTAKPAKGKGAVYKQPSREDLLKQAANPATSAAKKREIAYALLNGGNKSDAMPLFEQLAADKSPDSKDIKDLIYLWGGKIPAERLEWIRARAKTASIADQVKWADLVGNYAGDRSVIEYASGVPGALYSKTLRQKYFRLLASSGNKQDFDVAMRDWVAKTGEVPALMDYAETAQANGFQDAALRAYRRISELDPANTKALSALSVMTYASGSYSQAGQYNDRAVAAEQVRPDATVDASVTHFYRAQLLKNQGRQRDAQIEFTNVVNIVSQSKTQAVDALSRMYISQFNLGQGQQAIAGFHRLLAQHPNDKNILADFMGALIEHKYYDEATRVANQYDKGSNSGTTSREAVKPQAWLAPRMEGETITQHGDIIVRIIPTAQEAYVITPTAPMQQSTYQVETARQQQLRLQLLYAQIEQQTGQTDRARMRLDALARYYPNDPQLLSYRAGLESASGNREQAVTLLQQAQAQAPQNEAIARNLYDLQHLSSRETRATIEQYAKLDEEYRRYGDNDEFITTLSGAMRASNRNEIGASIQDDEIQPKAIIDPKTGLITDKSVSHQAGEMYLAHYFDGGTRGQLSLFGDGAAAGGGAYMAFDNLLGRTELLGEYHKAYWDYPEAVYAYANRDRVGLHHFVNLSRTTSLGLETSYNNYNIEVADEQAQTGLFRLSLMHQLQPKNETQPYFGIGYGFDGEYLVDKPELRTVGTITYRPFVFRDREVHFLSGLYQDDWTPTTHATLMAGYTYDRFNESGPAGEARLVQDLTKKWELGVRARYAIETSANNADAVDAGAHLKYKF